MAQRLSRDDIIGGAALSLFYFDREVTSDVDAKFTSPTAVQRAVREVGEIHDWDDNWLNSEAAQFIPAYGKTVGWSTLYADTAISISVASHEALLAMKLAAARPGKDENDLAYLLSLNDVTTIDGAEALLESYYPGDGLKDAAMRILASIFEKGLPPRPTPPEVPKI